MSHQKLMGQLSLVCAYVYVTCRVEGQPQKKAVDAQGLTE